VAEATVLPAVVIVEVTAAGPVVAGAVVLGLSLVVVSELAPGPPVKIFRLLAITAMIANNAVPIIIIIVFLLPLRFSSGFKRVSPRIPQSERGFKFFSASGERIHLPERSKRVGSISRSHHWSGEELEVHGNLDLQELMSGHDDRKSVYGILARTCSTRATV
jgi:hypothetical protein